MLKTLTDSSPSTLRSIREEMRVRKTSELFLLFSLGSQFDHLIKQHLSALGVFCLVADPKSVRKKDIQKIRPIGIILSGGPASAYTRNMPFDSGILDLGIPVLGICLGFQIWAHHLGAKVLPAKTREFGVHTLYASKDSLLFEGVPHETRVLESHGDRIERSSKIKIIAYTEHAPVSAGYHRHLWGVQFHPEVSETESGKTIFKNFCFRICGAQDQYPAEEVAKQKVRELRELIRGKRVLIALSGGSDSSVVAYLLREAAKNNSTKIFAVYIRGIDRPDDEAFVRKYFGNKRWLSLTVIDVTKKYLSALRGHTEMHEKRVAMRGIYKEVLEKMLRTTKANYIAQGTLYTDISESGGGYQTGAEKAQIKLHHNINLDFSVPELLPLADCVKDSARIIGTAVGVPAELLYRHPFPGPGLIVRIEGEITAENLTIARHADGIFIDELRKASLYEKVWQAGAVVTASHTAATKGDGAAQGIVIALWAVWSINGFTAQWAELPYDFLRTVSRRITNEIREVGAVVYKISDKPPATIEWG